MANWIETEHLGYAIRYAENEDVWRCEALALDGKTLSALKSKMGKTLADARRVEPIPVLIVERSYGAKYRTGMMTLPDDGGKKAWCMIDNGTEWWNGRQRPAVKRELIAYDGMVPDTAENRAALDALQAEWVAHYENAKTLEAKRDALPRIVPK